MEREIEKVTFLSGRNDDAWNERWLKRIKEEGEDIFAIIERLKAKGEEGYQDHNKYLFNIVMEADDYANDDSLSIIELQNGNLKLKRYLKRLTDIINKSVDIEPEASSFVTEFKVFEKDGSEYIVNEGLNAKIEKLYLSKIPSIENCISIIETKIKYLEQHSKEEYLLPEIDPVEKYPKADSHKLILLNELGIIKKLRSKTKNDSELGQLIAVILDVTDPTKIGTLVRRLSYTQSDPERKLYTERSTNAITAILTQFGIKPDKE